VFATFLLALSTVIFCLGSSIAIFVIARLLQGGSSALTWTAGLALLSDTVGQVKIGKAMGFCSVGLNSGLFGGPIVGGLVLEKSGFTDVFIVTSVLITADLGLRLLVVEQRCAQRYAPPPKSLYWIITYGLHGTPSISPSPCAKIEDVAPLLLSSDNDSELAAYPNPGPSGLKLSRFRILLPMLSLLRHRRFCVLLWANFAKIAMITAFDAVLPLFTHDTFGWGPLGGGLIFIPVVLPALVAPLVGELSDKYGSRPFIFGGFAMATPFSVSLRFVRDDTMGHIALLCSLMSFLGLATVLITAPVMSEITYLVEAEERRQPGIFGSKGAYAQAYALFSFTTAAGLLVGPCWGGFMANATGWATMTLTLGLFCAITAIPMFSWLR
jgi:MFS family permease